MAREFICLYFSWLETGATLTDEEFGRMCRAGLQYGLDGTEPDLPGNDKILFPVMKWQVDRDVSKFDEICQKRREAGSRGGKSKSKQSEANQANATFAKQNEANVPDIPEDADGFGDIDPDDLNADGLVDTTPPEDTDEEE